MSIRTRAVFLAGANHRIQYTNASCGPAWKSSIHDFEGYFVFQMNALLADLLAEEFNEELLPKNCAGACTGLDAAVRAGYRHLFCEPPGAQFKEGGQALFEARERSWLEVLGSTDATRIIFVCGDDHLQTFATRIKTDQYVVGELSRRWGEIGRFFSDARPIIPREFMRGILGPVIMSQHFI